MKRSSISQIRSLRWDEPLPEGQPKRYRHSEGYVRLRWKVGTEQYVEEYEHRIVAGRPHPRYHVHHKNEIKDDNRPENLEVLTPEEHKARHQELDKATYGPAGKRKYGPYRSRSDMEKAQRRLAREVERRVEVERMRELYESGLSTIEVGRIVGIDESNVYRRLTAAGVRIREQSDYAGLLDEEAVLRMYLNGRGYKAIAREFAVDALRVRKVLVASGAPLRGPGAVKGQGAQPGERKARRLVYARSNGACEANIDGVCASRAGEWHHRKNRSQGGRWQSANGLHLCVRCHGAITNTNGNRAAYEAAGWIVPSYADPAATPVLLARPDGTQLLALLDDLGGWTPAQPHPEQVGRAAA